MKKLQFVLTAIALFSFLVSCTETVAPVLTGNISGFVSLYEEDGTQVNNKSGVKVSIEGRNNYAFTDSNGRYKLENVEAGIFNIVFEKAQFGTHKIIAREFVGGGDAYLYTVELIKLPTFTVTSMTINYITTQPPYLSIRGNVSDFRNYYRYVLLFFGKNINVSNDPQNYLHYNSIYVYPDSASYGYSFGDYKNYFLSAGFNSGETIYVAAYSVSNGYWWGIPDPITGRYYFYNVGTPPVKSSFVLD